MRLVSAHNQIQATKKESDGTPLHLMLVITPPSLILLLVLLIIILTPHVVVGVQLGQHLMGVRVDALAVVLCNIRWKWVNNFWSKC